jgi:hypothetical protein
MGEKRGNRRGKCRRIRPRLDKKKTKSFQRFFAACRNS